MPHFPTHNPLKKELNLENIYQKLPIGIELYDKDRKTRSHTDNFGENNVKCLIAKGICRFVPHSSAGGF